MKKEIIKDKKFLLTPCKNISTKNNPHMDQVVNDLLYTAESIGFGCSGLAANQIGYNDKIIVVWINKGFVAMVNPEINCYGKKVIKHEGCLSFPGKRIKRKRYNKVKISYYDPFNKIRIPCLKVKEWEARAVQHEVDHLNGKTIC